MGIEQHDEAEKHHAEIAQFLAQLTAHPPVRNRATPNRQRQLEAAPPLGLPTALLAEVDATVMARCLVFFAPGGASLHAEVSNRRLLHFKADLGDRPGTRGGSKASRDLAIGAAPSSADHTSPTEGVLTSAGIADVSRLAAAIEDLCRSGPLTVESRPPTGVVSAESAGVGVAVLRQALAARAPPGGEGHAPGHRMNDAARSSGTIWAGPDATELSPPQRTHQANGTGSEAPRALSRFVHALGPRARAWRLLTGRSGGEPVMADALEQMLEEWCSLGFAPPGETHATVLTPVASNTAPVFFGQTIDDVLAVALQNGSEEGAIALWLDCLASPDA
ncbi:MAG: hypothetical protein AAGG09_04390 [Pseudomonadota bacterium]